MFSKYIIGTNLLTKFHEDRKINVTSRVLTRKNALPPWWPYIIRMNLLTEFHEDRTINVASRVLTRFYYSHIKNKMYQQTDQQTGQKQYVHHYYSGGHKNATPLGSHVFQANATIFYLIHRYHWTNLLTKFHEDRKINVASRVLTRKNAPPLGSHVFQAKVTMFELIQDIIRTNFLSKFHEDQKINVASRVLTRKNALQPGGHVFQPTGIIFELFQDIIGMNLLTKFHEDQTINVASRVLTRFYYSQIRKNARPLGSHVFQANVTIFKLIQDIIETNLLTKFHEDWTINVASRLLTRQMLTTHNGQRTTDKRRSQRLTISTLCSDIIGTNLLTKFHEDQKINVASRVLTRKNAPPPGSHVFQPTGIIFELVQNMIRMNLLTKKIAPPLGSHVFQANIIIFKLIQDIIETNLLTKFHEDWTINVASRVLTRKHAPPPGGHVFKATKTIFELIQDIIRTNLLTKFHDDRKINVTLRVLTRKNAPPPWWPCFQPTGIIFELVQDLIAMNLLTEFYEDRTINVASRENAQPLGSHTNLLTKFHEDWTINLASRVFTRQMLTPHDGQKAITKAHHEHVVLR
ncbi:hypothetical protein DPMN_107780 [Dreissena polymorpha]|uniref:Uncharacterized protein n=1 Tax=Dreissena polymorpha TaxID=45954 RepID=A0A9D4K7N9_DREPO|nr:hypothetical protein DPMN_107780 [Dreissena polymorpha]